MNLGRQGELLFSQIMSGRGYKVQDTTMRPDCWNKDIDFIITSPTSGARKTFEVKYDSRINQTGNLYLEIMNTYSQGLQGWFNFCKADYLAYGDAKTQTFYIIPFQELKERVEKMPKRLAYCGENSAGYLISLKDIKDIIKIL